VEQFVDTFVNQSVDFFSAVRSRIYDEQVRQFIHEVGVDRISQRVVNSVEGPPLFRKPNFNLSQLIEMGQFMVGEQQRVEDSQLVTEYNRGLYSRKLSTPKSIPTPSNSTENSSPSPTPSNGYYKSYIKDSHLFISPTNMN
jgi:hypothetical protein